MLELVGEILVVLGGLMLMFDYAKSWHEALVIIGVGAGLVIINKYVDKEKE